jgi:leucyl-tRNA synthetase
MNKRPTAARGGDRDGKRAGEPAGPRTNPRADRYLPAAIETKWQQRWERDGIYCVPDSAPGKRNWFALTMFPYPSGDLHVGHWYAFAPADAHARFRRMQGYNVLHPQGFDAFGLPAENAAIAHNMNPREWTRTNIENMRRQFKMMGNSYDWGREIVSCDPAFYRWNQYFFLKFLEKGLAYRDRSFANWCPNCQTTLANEQVKEGACERCSTIVTKREMDQWFFRITKYAEELLDTSKLEWPEKIKLMQRNWIGRSEGVTIEFDVSEYGLPAKKIATFTTRIDTVHGVTFLALAPEHPLVATLTRPGQKADVETYVARAIRASEIERTSTEREKTGVPTGAYATNPLNGERVPVLVGDYVLFTYGTGAVMGVPAHDERDFVFAKKYDLPVRVVVAPPGWQGEDLDRAYVDEGTQVNSGEFDGLPSGEGMTRIADKIEASGWGTRTVKYHLRDWVISRQRYWGTPIPVVYCDRCGTVPVPERNLPVLLPDASEFKPTGESPLKLDPDFVNTACPSCGGAARRETDTMDTFVDSSWYHARYTSVNDDTRPFNPEVAARWLPVHQYMGGVEHAVMHLLYSRFFNKVLRDLGYLSFDEPYTRLFNQGVLIKEHKKISKRSNPLAPDPLVKRYGADAVRLYLMFLGPWDQGGDWSDAGIAGITRFLNRVWDIAQRDAGRLASVDVDENTERELTRHSHSTTKKVIADLDAFKFNTAIAALMEFSGELNRAWDAGGVSPATWQDAIERLTLLLAPMAPHIAEELWHRSGRESSVHLEALPRWDEALASTTLVTVVVQVNGKVRDTVQVPVGATEAQAAAAASASAKVQAHLTGKQVRKRIYVQNRLLNLVVG